MEFQFALLLFPADEAVAWSCLPGSSSEAEQRNDAVVGFCKITKLRAGERLITEVMIAIDVLIPKV